MENIIDLTGAVLSTTSSRWQALAGSLPGTLLARKPDPQNWSALECLQHLMDVEAVFQARLQAFLAGKDFPAFNPDVEGSAPAAKAPQELAAEFARLRAASLAMIQALQPGDLARRVRHAELGPVSLGEMLHEWSGHDLMHTVQAERALMQPFIQGCGPWIKYFADHVVKVT